MTTNNNTTTSSSSNKFTSSRWFLVLYIVFWFFVGFFLSHHLNLSGTTNQFSNLFSPPVSPKEQKKRQQQQENSVTNYFVYPRFFFSDPNTTQRPLKDGFNPKVALTGYMDLVPNAKYELEWMFFTMHGSDVKADIILSGHPQARKLMPSFCESMTHEESSLERARELLDRQKCLANGWPGRRRLNQGDDIGNVTFPCNVRCLVILQKTDDKDSVRLNYQFLRSLNFPLDPIISQLLTQDYDYIKKTDLDVFITPIFNKLRPPGKMIYVGQGGYSHMKSTEQKIQAVAKELSLSHRGLKNVGATFFGESKFVLDLTRLTRNVTIYFLETQWGPGVKNEWPAWWRGVASMYGGEVAVNHMAPDYIPKFLDGGSRVADRTCATASIHAWHQPDMFSKFEVHNYNRQKYLAEWDQFKTHKELLRFLSSSGHFALYTAMHVKNGTFVPPKGVWKGLC